MRGFNKPTDPPKSNSTTDGDIVSGRTKKEELMNALEDVSTDLQKKSDEIGIEELRKKYGDS